MKQITQKLPDLKELKYLATILAAVYLTFLTETYIPDATQMRLPVFLSFLALCVALVYLKKRFFKKPEKPEKTALLSAAAALVLVVVCQNILLPRYEAITISLRAGSAGEVCFCDVLLDGQNIPISEIPVKENNGWLYREEYDNFVIYPQGDGAENCLTLEFPVKKVELVFVSAPWSGNVTVSTPASENLVELRADEDTRLNLPINYGRAYTLFERLALSAGAAVILWFLCSALLPCLDNKARYKRRDAVLALMAMDYFLLFFTSPRIAPTVFTRLLLAALTAASALCMLSEKARDLLKNYQTRGRRIYMLFAALYASFASFGQRFFLEGNTRIHGSAPGLFYLLLGTLWFLPVICLLLLGLEWLSSSRRPGGDPACRRLVFWTLLVMLCVCQAVILYSFWPGEFPSDCVDQVRQAAGLARLSDWHPVLHTLCYRLILAITPHAGAIVGVQMFFFALLCAEFLTLGYDYGVPFKVLAALGVVFTLLPNQVFSGVGALKDYPYTLALLWGTWLLIRLALDAGVLEKWWFLVAMPVDLFLIYGFRHNGVVPFFAVILLFLVITARHYPRVKLSLTAVSLSAVLLVVACKGPLFYMLGVSPGTVSPYTTMLCAAASCVNKELPLSEESTAILESVLPLDQWRDYYDRYQGHDQYYWSRGEQGEEYPFNPGRITAKEAFSVYLEALRKHPDVVIKDRLDGMDILWDVSQPSDSFNRKNYTTFVEEDDPVSRYFDFGDRESGAPYANDTPLAAMYREIAKTARNSVFDMLLWRSGASLILLLALFLFWWEHRMKTLLWASVPLLGNMAGLILALYHQSFRYVYAVQLITVALAFCTVCLRDREARAVPVEELSNKCTPPPNVSPCPPKRSVTRPRRSQGWTRSRC